MKKDPNQLSNRLRNNLKRRKSQVIKKEIDQSLLYEEANLYIGIMSGTSADGIDASLISINKNDQANIKLIKNHYLKYPKDFTKKLIQISKDCKNYKLDDWHNIRLIEEEMNCLIVQSVEELLKDANINYQAVRAVGFSGYNIYHKRSEQNQYHTHQIGNCYKLASSIKIDVIEDFRAADIAAGGTGAPLAPIYHKLLLENGKDAIYPACVLNIGGVSNITYIESKDSKPEELVAFDSSVGNCLMDDFALKAFNKTYDKDGYIAASGKINYALIDKIISEDKYFKQSYPKAIDRNHFNYVINKIKEVVLSKEDIIACLNYFTAKSIFESCKYLPKEPKALYLTGGGGFNKELVKNIKTLFKNSKICNICAIAPEDKKDLYDPNYLESILFAYLTHRFFMRNVSSFKNTTGVRKQVVLGRMCKANIEQ